MARRLSKRSRRIAEQCDRSRAYAPGEAFELLKQCPRVKFGESVDASVRLGVDARKGDQMVRGAASLPHGLGKPMRVAVFAAGDKAAAAEQAGADAVGLDDLIERARSGDFDYDAVIATPAAMSALGKIGAVLGPRGLMPNPKEGTVTDDVAAAVRAIKKGRARYRIDKAGIVHCSIGRLDFDGRLLEENLNALIAELVRVKPAAAKGIYLKKVSVSSTMGPGLVIDQGALSY